MICHLMPLIQYEDNYGNNEGQMGFRVPWFEIYFLYI